MRHCGGRLKLKFYRVDTVIIQFQSAQALNELSHRLSDPIGLIGVKMYLVAATDIILYTDIIYLSYILF